MCNEQKKLMDMTLDELMMLRVQRMVEEQIEERSQELGEWEDREKRPRVEDTSKRATFLLDKKLLARLNTLAEDKERGFKTWFVGKAIEDMLDRIEKEESK